MLENKLYYEDEYMYFSFNGKYSKDYNLMIQNGVDDFKIITNENANIDYVSPKYQNGRYVMGVTRSHRSIPHKLVAYGLTRSESNEMADWLRVGTNGPLIYEYAPDWQYNVIVGKLGDFNLYPIDTKHFIVSFDISFDTIEGTDAENVQDSSITIYATDVQSENTYYGVNNCLLIPSMACYCGLNTKDVVQIDGNYYKLPIYIHHIGNGHTLLNVSANVGAGDASLYIQSKYVDNSAFISYEAKPGNSNVRVVEYKTHNHLFFINNEMPEYKVLYSEIDNLNISYSNESIIFHSPGAIKFVCDGEAIGTVEDLKEKLGDYAYTPYPWFIYYTTDLNDNTIKYYQTDGAYPTEITGTFVYDSELLANKGYTVGEGDEAYTYYETEWNNAQLGNLVNQLTNEHKIYFGFYDQINITATPLNDITINTTQFTNLLLGGQ